MAFGIVEIIYLYGCIRSRRRGRIHHLPVLKSVLSQRQAHYQIRLCLSPRALYDRLYQLVFEKQNYLVATMKTFASFGILHTLRTISISPEP